MLNFYPNFVIVLLSRKRVLLHYFLLETKMFLFLFGIRKVMYYNGVGLMVFKIFSFDTVNHQMMGSTFTFLRLSWKRILKSYFLSETNMFLIKFTKIKIMLYDVVSIMVFEIFAFNAVTCHVS